MLTKWCVLRMVRLSLLLLNEPATLAIPSTGNVELLRIAMGGAVNDRIDSGSVHRGGKVLPGLRLRSGTMTWLQMPGENGGLLAQ